MKAISAIVAIAMVPALAGCVSTAYKAPPPGESARLRIIDPQLGWRGSLKAFIYPSGECEAPMELGMVGGIGRLSAPKALSLPGDPGIDPKDTLERSIPAGHPILMTFAVNSLDGRCVGTARITAKRGADYQADIRMEADGCKIHFGELRAGQGGTALYLNDDLHKAPLCLKGF